MMSQCEARIFLLEEAVRSARSAMEFMHGCLTDPQRYSYEHPNQTLRTMKRMDELVKPVHVRDSCPHSVTKQWCEACQARNIRRAKRAEARAALGLPDGN